MRCADRRSPRPATHPPSAPWGDAVGERARAPHLRGDRGDGHRARAACAPLADLEAAARAGANVPCPRSMRGAPPAQRRARPVAPPGPLRVRRASATRPTHTRSVSRDTRERERESFRVRTVAHAGDPTLGVVLRTGGALQLAGQVLCARQVPFGFLTQRVVAGTPPSSCAPPPKKRRTHRRPRTQRVVRRRRGPAVFFFSSPPHPPARQTARPHLSRSRFISATWRRSSWCCAAVCACTFTVARS